MKPHEETWIIHPNDYRAICDLNPEDPSESLVIADLRVDEPRDVATLIAAAPEMARAILRHLDTFPKCSCGACARCDMQNAIAKAGVVP